MTDMPETAFAHRAQGKPGERVGTWAEWITPSATKYVRGDIHQALREALEAEVERLRLLVEAAYYEGADDMLCHHMDDPDVAALWEQSAVRDQVSDTEDKPI